MHQVGFLLDHICCGEKQKMCEAKQFIPGKHHHQNILAELESPNHWLSLLVSCLSGSKADMKYILEGLS